jgi:hypothetical protein
VVRQQTRSDVISANSEMMVEFKSRGFEMACCGCATNPKPVPERRNPAGYLDAALVAGPVFVDSRSGCR